MIDKNQDFEKHTHLQSYFEEKTGLKETKYIFGSKEPKNKDSLNESFVFLNIANYSYQELDNLIDLYFNELWDKKERFEIETNNPNQLKIVFENENQYSVIVTRYTNINLKNNTYSLLIEFFKNKSALKNAMRKLETV